MNKIPTELPKIVDCIQKNTHKRVMLQFPDHLLPSSMQIKTSLEELLKKREIADVEIILAADK